MEVVCEEVEQTEIIIPEKKNSSGLLSCRLIGLDSISIFTEKRPALKSEKHESRKESQFKDHMVHVFSPTCILLDHEVRKLVNESNSTFLSSRNPPSSTIDLRTFYLSLSHEHRSSIRQCIENLQLRDREVAEYKDWIEMFDNIEIVWHLCELLHLDSLVGEFVVRKLVEWIRFHCSEVEIRASCLLLDDRPEVTAPEDYWDLVTGLLLQARFEATRAILKLHSNAHTTPFVEADGILLAIPVFSSLCGLSENEFVSKWKAWKSSVRSKVNSGIFSNQPQLLNLMEMLAGDETTVLRKLKRYCDTWYQLLCASLVFVNPTARLDDLPYYAKLCLDLYSQPELKLLDLCVKAIIESDLPDMVAKLQLCADGGWSATHLANLLQLSGAFTLYPAMEAEVESLMIDYGSVLIRDPGLLAAGVTYFEKCPVRGKALLRLTISSTPLTSERRAYFLLDLARRNNLSHAVVELCRTMCLDYMRRDLVNNALQWALESQDATLMSQVADRLLSRYAADASFRTSGLHLLGAATSPSDRLTFAAKYAEFINLESTNQIKEATDLVITLMDVKVIPEFFYSSVLSDVYSLLEVHRPLLTTTQCLVVLECLSDLAQSETSESLLSKIDVIRKSVAHRLATSMIEDLSSSSSRHIVIPVTY